MINRRTGGYNRGGYRRVGLKRLSRRGPGAFFRTYAKAIAVIAVLLAAGAICIVLFTGGGEKEAVAQVSPEAASSGGESATPVPTIDLSEYGDDYDYDGVGEDVLAGLGGTDDSLFTEEGGEVLVTSGIKIGITLGNIDDEYDRTMLAKLSEATGDAYNSGRVYQVYCYDAQGDYNQQLQDLRSLVKDEVDVIIAGACDEESFKMISFMAQQEGIPLVAYDAPADSGYAVNVISDQASWGERFGRFMADNLAAGSVLEVMGSEKSSVDAARGSAIGAALSNTALNVSATYASWSGDKAQDSVSGMLEDGAVIDGVIAVEGTAGGVLEAFIGAKKLPKVMCGDTTAGFIKKWYALKNGGIVIVPPAEKKHSPPPVEVFAAKAGEFIVCAQPAPSRASAIAFEIALKLAEGRTLVSQDAVYKYAPVTMITDENLSYYYEMVKDMPDTFTVGDAIDEAAAESLFNPLQ